MRRVLTISAMVASAVLLLTSCVAGGDSGPSRASSVQWARATSTEILKAVSIDATPISTYERQGVCTAIDYSFDKWASWTVDTVLPIDPADRLPLLDRVTEAYVNRAAWTVLGDNPGEIGPPSEAKFMRGLQYTTSIDDQGADVTVSPDSTTVDISVRSACYIAP